MDFTDRLACSGPTPVFSPDRRLLASADGYRLVVRDADSLAVVALASCLDRVESIAWSPDSDHLLCGLFRRATVQVFCASDPDWACTIAEGPAGVTAARWAPDGRHILLTADFNVRLAVWSLVDQACQYLRGPKHAATGLAFSPDGALLAVLHVRLGCGAATRDGCVGWVQRSSAPASAAGRGQVGEVVLAVLLELPRPLLLLPLSAAGSRPAWPPSRVLTLPHTCHHSFPSCCSAPTARTA